MLKFGTDGVRGVANAELTPELVLDLGRAAARTLGGRRFLVGRDTRVSGPLLQAALAAGIAAEGVDVVDLGVLPTPAVAAISQADRVPAAMISASHNPYTDNGVKLFAAGGRKLPDDVEERLEGQLGQMQAGRGPNRDAVTGAGVGRITRDDGAAVTAYADHVVAALGGRRLDGLRVIVDCANGAACRVAPEVLRRLGATVGAIGTEPDGTNINEGCGSNHPQLLQRAVVDAGADVGLAFDGDADRMVAVDAEGIVVDGDAVMALCAADMHERGLLHEATVVVTVMTNLGFRLAMASRGIEVVETKVGDRYVLEALDGGQWSLGGEQSGHVIFRDLATTGDGLLTGALLLDLVSRRGRPLHDLAAESMTRLPQELKSIRVKDRDGLDDAAAVWAEVDAVEAELGGQGRVVLRPSGTEPLVRVMVEAPTQDQAEAAVERICASLVGALGPGDADGDGEAQRGR